MKKFIDAALAVMAVCLLTACEKELVIESGSDITPPQEIVS